MNFTFLGRTLINNHPCRMYSAPTKGGELRLLASLDPTPEGNFFHVSASVGRIGQQGAFRKPTDEEIWFVRSAFSTYVFEECPNEGENKFVRHLWEVKSAKATKSS